jgi:type I restriction enzyme S subunit
MSYPRYQEYIKSGVEWLGQTPSTWTIKRVGYFFSERREKVSDKDFQPLSVTKNGIVPQLESAAKSDDGDNRKKVCIGDFVINSRSDRKGSSGASSLNGSVSLINTVIFPNKNIDIKFAHHLFRSTLFQEEYYRYGKGIVADLWSTNYSEMKNISIPIPHLNEQKTIVAFLENETVKIDTLIVQQEKLIELLKEKRQSVISNAVTKGLKTKVKMKDSGISWLGELPETWHMRRVKDTAYVKGRVGWKGLTSDEYLEEGYSYLVTGTDFKYKYIDWNECHCVNQFRYEDDPYIQLKNDDLLITKDGTIGKLALIQNLHKPACLNSGIFLVRPLKDFITEYMYWILSSEIFNIFCDLNSYGSTIQHLYQNVFERFIFPAPPIDVQREISLFLNTETAKIDLLLNEAYSLILLLNERRSALISAAVTGQIDLRNYQIKEAA